MLKTLFDSIRKYAQEGYATFPTSNKRPLRGGESWKQSFIDVFPEDKNYPYKEFGVVLKPDDLVIDIDPRNFPEGRKVWTEFCDNFQVPKYIQKTTIVQTGSGGMHVYLKKPGVFKIRKNLKDFSGIDFLSEGAYCIGSGSIVKGNKYKYKYINDEEKKEAPAVLLNAIQKQIEEFNLEGNDEARDSEDNKARFIEYLINQTEVAVEGKGGDQKTFIVACKGRDHNLTADATLELLWTHYNPRCFPPWQYVELHNKVRNAYAYATRPAGTADPVAALPDMGDAPIPNDNEWMRQLDTTQKGAYRNTLNNCVLFINNDKLLKGKFRFNEFTSKIEIYDHLPWEEQRINTMRAINDLEVSHAALYLSRTFRVEFTTSKCWEALHIVANQKTYHPIKDELKSIEWDGVKRLDTWLLYYCGALDSAYTRAVGRKTLIGACARIFNPGCKFDHVLILEGVQGVGKSTTCEILGGKWFGDANFDIQSKDTVEYVHSHWIIEFAEMATTRKADVNKLKNFITRTTDDTRLPYARARTMFPRQCIFIGTVNPDSIGYLTDDTGNRRFWPVYCKSFKLTQLKKDRDQLLAEALDCYRKGEHLYLTREIEGSAAQETKERIVKDPWNDVISKWIDEHPEILEFTSEMIYTLALGGSTQNLNTGHARRIVSALTLYGAQVSRRSTGMAYIRNAQHNEDNPFAIK